MTNAQLRIYTIGDGLMDEWVERFNAEIVPPRRTYGFDVVGTWVNEAANQFIWIVSYDGDLDWDAAVDRYYGSPERGSITFDPMDYIVEMDTRLLVDV